MDLEEDLDALEGGGDEGHGDGGEEAGGGELGNCEWSGGVYGGGKGADEALTDVVALDGSVSFGFVVEGGKDARWKRDDSRKFECGNIPRN